MTSEQKTTSRALLKNALFVVLVAATAFVGVKLGMGSKGSESDIPQIDQHAPESKLKPGVTFPNIPVLAEDGSSLPSQSLVSTTGGVVIFMDLACPPCKEMSEKLQKAYISDLSDVAVIGISPDNPHNVTYYRKEHGITFPVYSDTAFTFMTQYQVQNFPLLVIIGKSGEVRDFTFDARLPIDADRIHALIEQ